ncbi:hypothetical protein TNCV_4957141 [Trichonephila clavipes]|nr:hypothetical protein TNCV_4957141 [Trichonephila clavipes]
MNGQTVYKHYYIEVPKSLCEKNKEKKGQNSGVMDGCCTKTMHTLKTALSVKQFLTSKNITEMVHPPYSPDLAPRDFSFCLLQLNLIEKQPILTELKRFKQKRKIFQRDFRKPRSRTAPNADVCEC